MRKFAALYLFVFAMLLFQSCKTAKGIDRKQTEMKMLEALEWQEAHPIQVKAPTDWTNGAYYTGVAKAHQSTKNKEFLDALISMGQRNNWQPWERYFHADDLAITYPYLYLESIGVKAVDLEPTQKIIQEHLYKPHAWKEGEKEMEEILWWWCDALFMAPPALTLYADLQDNRQYLDEMHKYYMETYNLLYDKEEHLFARDNRFLWKGEDSDKKDENGRKIFWSRGNGWVLGGLALLLEKMPEDYEHRSFYEGLYKEMAAKIKEIQPQEGLWTTSLLSPESYDHGEVSGSGFFTFAMAWGINNDLLDADEYKPTVLRAWKGLQAAQQESGKVGWVQNIGFDPRPADVDSWQNYGTGAFLLAGSEMLKLK